MSRCLFPLALFSLVALVGCGASTSAPSGALSPSPDPVTALNAPGQTAQEVWGAFDLTISPTLDVALTPPRDAAWWDVIKVSTRQFLQPKDMMPLAVRRTPTGARLTLRVSHPIPVPPTQVPPGSPSQRIDRHAFRPVIVVIGNGAESYNFGGGSNIVRTNTSLLANASGYFESGRSLAVPPSFSANTFPFKHVTPLDAGSVATNYLANLFGWQGTEVFNPTGYGIFAQGSSHVVDLDFIIAPNTTFQGTLALMVDYQDPKNPPGFPFGTYYIPAPGQPSWLYYILPYDAGDNSQITCTFPDPTTNQINAVGSQTTRMVISIIDWDNISPTTTGFPNTADLSRIPSPSGTASVQLLIPGVTNGPVAAIPIVGGTGRPDAPIRYEVTIDNDLLAAPGFYQGLVKVRDQEDKPIYFWTREFQSGSQYYLDYAAPSGTAPNVSFQSCTIEVIP